MANLVSARRRAGAAAALVAVLARSGAGCSTTERAAEPPASQPPVIVPGTPDAKVKSLAERIRVGQQPEIEAMRQLLTLMIKHHQGAVTMSGTVMDKGTDPQVGELAQEVGVPPRRRRSQRCGNCRRGRDGGPDRRWLTGENLRATGGLLI